MTYAPGKFVTAVTAIGVLAVFFLAASVLTDGFKYWTFEEKRIAQAREGARTISGSHLITTGPGNAPHWPERGSDKLYLVDFIYTSCPSVCLTLGSEYQRMQQSLRQLSTASAQVKLLSLSFDSRDRPENLKHYSERFHADPDIWTVSAPSTQDETSRLLSELGVVVVPDGLGGYVHNAAIHLITGDGQLVGIFPYGEWDDALTEAMRFSRSRTAPL